MGIDDIMLNIYTRNFKVPLLLLHYHKTTEKKMAIIVRLKFKEILPLSLAAAHSETKGSKNVPTQFKKIS